jgi:glycosyltransferase involved in cell wall biosynthesis
MTIAVAQLGARMNYAVPRIAAQHNLLDTFYTDFYGMKPPFGWLRHVPTPGGFPIHTLMSRSHASLPARSVVHFPWFGLAYPYRRDRSRTQEERLANFIEGGRIFNRYVIRQLQKRPLPTVLYTFNSAGLELIRFARERGIRTVHEQTIVNHRVERALIQREQEQFPAWQQRSAYGPCSDAYAEREEEEQTLVDSIVCGSPFVRQHSQRPDSTWVIPYGVEGNPIITWPAERRSVRGPLRVLVVGYVDLRKGCEYTLQAAKQLAGRATFRLVGDYSMTPARVLADFRKQAELTGVVPRSAVANHYQWADVFLLPSICEGSATVTYEALQYGLPQVVTPNTGSLIRHGREGFVVGAGDVSAIVSAIDKLAADEPLRLSMAHQALQRAKEATYETYASRLIHHLQAGR